MLAQLVLAQLAQLYPKRKGPQAANGIKDFQGFGSANSIVSRAPTSQSTTQGPAAGTGNVEALVGSVKSTVCTGTVGLDYASSVLRIEFIP